MSGPAVIAARTRRDLVLVRGDDAVTYLQGQLSQDVAGLPVGESACSFVLAPQGKVDGWGRVHRTAEDAFEIDVDPGAGLEWEARLRRFLLRTRAEILVEPGWRRWPSAARPSWTLPLAGPSLVGSDLLRVDPDAWPGDVPPDAVEVGPAALEARRIRAGIPVWGREIDHETIPATLGDWVIGPRSASPGLLHGPGAGGAHRQPRRSRAPAPGGHRVRRSLARHRRHGRGGRRRGHR
ncbi:MAG: hypothetical protein R2702_19495 [Acidimicrobiales bacterium]